MGTVMRTCRTRVRWRASRCRRCPATPRSRATSTASPSTSGSSSIRMTWQQYNLQQEANKIDLAALTDEIVISKDGQGIQGEGNRVQIETDRMHNAGVPGDISQQQGTTV